MSKAEINKNLFVDKSLAPNESGIIDIGKNCSKCNQLDFLPFKCEFCNSVFCSNHRTLESHQCPGLSKVEKGRKHVNYAGPTASSLFPDREADKKKVNETITKSVPKATNILEKQFRVGDVASLTPNAFSKFNKFLRLQKKKGTSSKNSVFGRVFGSSSVSASASSSKNRVSELALLRKGAKGDMKITSNNRIYLWCLYVNPQNTLSDSEESELFEKINIERDRHPLFVSRAWPVGRALDSIADHLSIRNLNNSTRDSKERLYMFQLNGESPNMINTSERCEKAFKNGDVVYLVRGSI